MLKLCFCTRLRVDAPTFLQKSAFSSDACTSRTAYELSLNTFQTDLVLARNMTPKQTHQQNNKAKKKLECDSACDIRGLRDSI